MAASNTLVSHIQMDTFRERASLYVQRQSESVKKGGLILWICCILTSMDGSSYLDFLQTCVFSSVFATKELTFAVVRGPMGGSFW